MGEEIIIKKDKLNNIKVIVDEEIKKEDTSFYTYLTNKCYFFDKETVENYLLSLKVKPFVILTGNSGTGKTKLPQLYAEFLNSKLNKEIIEYDDEYIDMEVPIGITLAKYLKEGELFLDKRFMKRILPINKFEGNLKIKFDDIESNERLFLSITGICKSNSLSSYFKSISEESSISIRIKKEDIENTFKQEIYLLNNYSMSVTLGTSWVWNIPRNEISKILPLKNNIEWNIIINNKSTKLSVSLDNFRVESFKSKNNELLDYFERLSSINPKEKLKVSLDFNTFISDFEQEQDDSNQEIFSSEPIKKLKENQDLYKIVPVGANWTENRHILGYYNLISNKYQSTPSFDLIEKAAEDDQPYFLILDEMNLSHVERYFADFLSAIESEKPIPLYGKDEELEIPKNLFIIGTVNIDETTYMFSPKVLDRANTIEFDTCSPKKYLFSKFDNDELNGDIKYLENPLSDLDLRNISMSELKNDFANVEFKDEDFWTVLTNEITKFYDVLKGAGFDFGFRVIDEIVKFIYVAWKYEGKPTEFNNWQRYFDAQIKQKMLPKLHGSEKVLKDTLKDLLSLCEYNENDEDGEDDTSIKNHIIVYPNSSTKIKEMQKVLKTQRYVSFIN